MADSRDAWFYGDPPSQVGGSSPYEPPQQRKKIPETTVTPDNPPAYFYPTIVTVDDPPLPTLPKYLVQGLISAVSVPFRAAAVMASIVAAWAPDLAYASIGGAQPYAPRLGSPALIAPVVQANNPPFSHPGRTAGQAAVVASAWQVTDPAPTIPRHLTPPSVDNPPGFYQPTVVVVPRQPLPTLPGKIAAIIPPQPQVDNPPFADPGRKSAQAAIVSSAWQVTDPLPILAAKLTPPSVDNPPAKHPGRSAKEAAIVGSAWQVTDPLPTLGVKLTPPSVDNPPFTEFGRYPGLSGILNSWIPPDPLPTLAVKRTPPSVDNPPPRSAFVPFYPEAAPPLPTLPSKVAPLIPPPAQVDNPPFTSWSRSAAYAAVVSYAWLPPDPLPTLAGKVAPLIPAPQVDNPPSYFYPAIVTIDDPPLPTLGQRNVAAIIPPAQVDNPPFSHRGRSASVASLVAGLWQPADPPPTLGRKSAAVIPAPRADNPPFGLKPFSWGWGEPAITSIAVGDLILPNDNPPFSHPGRLAYLTAVINAAWLPPDPLPTLGGKIAAIIPVTPPQVDNPPSYFYPAIVTVDDPPLPTLGQRNVAAIIQPAQVDNPPFSYAGRAAYLATLVNAAWQPPDPLPTLAVKLTPPSVDNPPPRSPFVQLYPEAVPPLPTLPGKVAAIIPPSVVNNPPFSHPGRSVYLATLVADLWLPPDPLPTLIGKSAGIIPPPVVNNPPFTHRGRDPLPWIILQWQAPDPLPWIPFFNNASWNPGPPAPTGQGIQFTVSGDGVRQLFEDPASVSHTWSGVSHRTV